MRKAQISLQFNWIFIFIVGAIILIFFLMVVRSQTKESDFELAGDLIKSLDTVIKSSQNTGSSLNIIKIPAVSIDFVCEPDLSFYDIGNGVKKDIPYDIIFSQARLSGGELISWTQNWNLPFRIATFQYLTTRKTQFIIVNDEGGMAKQLFDMLPSNITKIRINPTDDIEDRNYDYYKIIQFENYPHQGRVNTPLEITHKMRIETNDLDSFGTIYFDGVGTHFIKKESLFGAIFSEDVDFYKCTMEKAFERLDTLMMLNYDRTSYLHQSISDSRCTTLYFWSMKDMNDIRDASGLEGAETIYENSVRLSRSNQNLIRGRNCPLIY